MVATSTYIPQASNAFMSFLLQSKQHAFVSMVTSAILINPNPLLSKTEYRDIFRTSGKYSLKVLSFKTLFTSSTSSH
jgi:hypothetical protein